MPSVAARVRIRNEADSADLVTLAMADLSAWPEGDGTAVNVITGTHRSGSYVVRVVDTGILTAVLNDGDGRGRLKSRRAYVEVQTDGGSWVQRIGGYITRVTIPDGYAVELEIGQTLRVPATALVPSSTLGATLNRGAIVGGPVIATWGPLASLGGWRGTVLTVSGRRVTLRIDRSYMPPGNVMHTTFGGIVGDVGLATAALAPFVEGGLTNVEFGGISDVNGNAPRLSARITRATDGQISVGTPRVVIVGSFLNPTVGTPIFTGTTDVRFTLDVQTGDPLPSVNDVVSLAIVSVDITPESPAYLDGHPIDVVATLYDSIGVARNTASFTAAKNALGSQLRYARRVTEPFLLQEWIDNTISGPMGVAFLPDASGAVEAIVMRRPLDSLPTDVITAGDVSEIGTLYEDVEDSTVARLVWEQEQYVLIPSPTADDPSDAVLTNRARQEFTIDSGTTFATRTISYIIDGQFYLVGQWPGSPDVVSSAQREQLAARYGRGAAETTLSVRRDAAVASVLGIGTYIRNQVPSLPSGSARLAALPGASRVQQVTAITETIGERVVTLEDIGPVAAAIATVPTLSVTTSGSSYLLTVTNAAALTSAGVGVRIEQAQTSGAAPASTDWTPLRSFAFNEISTVSNAVTTQPVTVWFRARAERPGSLPSVWSTSVSAAFAALASLTGLTAAAITGDGSRLAISWTRAATDGAVFDVFVRLSSQAQGAGIFATQLPAGSTSATATGLTAGTLYTVDVRARSVFGVDQAVFVTTTATTDGASVTLSNPSALSAYVPMSGFVALDGIVTGTPLPDAEVEIAQETAVGSGTFGAYAAGTTVAPAAGGAFTVVIAVASDNRLRRLRARAVRAGAVSSSFVVAPTDVMPDGSGML